MKRLRNLAEFEAVQDKEVLVFARANGERRIALKTVGPCVIWLQPLAWKGKAFAPLGEKRLLDVVEGSEELVWSWSGPFALEFDPSGPLFVCRFRKPLQKEVDEPVTFTRFEKVGLHVDELGVALHRQAILNRIADGRASVQRDAYQRGLERRLEELSAHIKALQPPQVVAPAGGGE